MPYSLTEPLCMAASTACGMMRYVDWGRAGSDIQSAILGTLRSPAMTVVREQLQFDPDRVHELTRATLMALGTEKASQGEMQIVASAILIAVAKRMDLSADDAARMLTMNWDLPQAQHLSDGLAKLRP